MEFRDLATVNACLNAASALLLLLGYRNIRRGRRDAHRKFMTGAFSVSILFLVCYLIYHAKVGSVPFVKTGWVRPLYFFILITHIVLAAAVAPMAIVTFVRAWKGNFERHRKLARITFPIWIYVSVSGVIVYLMLYHL